MQNEGMARKDREPAPRRRLWPRLAAAAALAGGALLVRQPIVAVLQVKNGDFLFMKYRFFEEDSRHPRLRLLRSRERLDQVAAPGRTQLEKVVLLRHWARSQWESGGKFYYPPWDAVEILDLARRHGNRGFCAQYAIVFAQACQSLGLHVRYGELGHFLTEVWIDELGHWVVMDPTEDVYYERDGAPLRGRELDEAAWKGRPRGIVKVRFDGGREAVTAEELKGWRGFSIVMRNNHLSDPVQIEQGGRMVPLVRQDDYRRYPYITRQDVAWGGELLAWRPQGWEARDVPNDRPATSDPDDFHNAYNQTMIFVVGRDAAAGQVKLKLLAEHAPDLEGFAVEAGGQTFLQAPPGDVVLMLKPGLNRFTARVRTSFGWLGRPSSVKLLYKPAWSLRIL
jgi:hypothetical protein